MRAELVAGAAVMALAAGLLHLGIAPRHWGHAPAHGLFFGLAGLAQVAWGIAFWRKPSARGLQAGAILVGALITLWVVTRVLTAPFSDEPSEIDVTGALSKAYEVMSFAALVVLTVLSPDAREAQVSLRHTLGTVAKLVAASLVAGGLAYQVATWAAPLAPWLGEEAAHADADPVAIPAAEEPPDGATRPAPSRSANAASEDLQLVVAGIGSPYVNGSQVPLNGDLLAELTMQPGDERTSRALDVHLYHGDLGPLTGATVEATARMRFMEHGTFRQTALELGQGQYLLLLQFPMPGEWSIELEIDAPGTHETIDLDIDLFD